MLLAQRAGLPVEVNVSARLAGEFKESAAALGERPGEKARLAQEFWEREGVGQGRIGLTGSMGRKTNRSMSSVVVASAPMCWNAVSTSCDNRVAAAVLKRNSPLNR